MHPECISKCRLCGWEGFSPAIDLGEMAFTGYFPKQRSDVPLSPGEEAVPRGPLELVECDACGLVQIAHHYASDLMYGPTYGYRSGLNASMAQHLKGIAEQGWRLAKPERGEAVVDIGANDGTLLNCYPDHVRRFAFDPLADKWAQYYKPGIVRFSGCFDAEQGIAIVGRDNAKIVTSIACFYDMPDPVGTARGIYAILKDGGIWILEQATTDSVIEIGAWDQICHEHMEYYATAQILDILERASLRLIGLQRNSANGDSWRIIAQKGGNLPGLDKSEYRTAYSHYSWDNLRARIDRNCRELKSFLEAEKSAGNIVWGYGASTKGNVVLQRAGIGPELLPLILDANEEKDCAETPGTRIPIRLWKGPWIGGTCNPEELWKGTAPQSFLVLPWHFRDFIIEKEHAFLKAGGKLVFALPNLEIVTKESVREKAA